MKKWILWIVVNLIFLAILYWISKNPLWVERYYVSLIYPNIAEFFSNIFDRLSFSLTEIVLILAIVWIVLRTLVFILRFFRFLFSLFTQQKRNFKTDLDRYLFGFFIFGTILFIFFYLSWGINYFRSPIEEKLSFLSNKSSQEHFSEVLNSLIDSANQRVDAYPISIEEIESHLSETMPTLIKEIEGNTIPIRIGKQTKTFFWNELLDQTLIQGFVNPIFQELHYNSSLTPEEISFTMAHERAHLYGYTQEGEANFLGYLACIRSKNRFVQFSGLVMAIRYFLFDLYYRLEQEEKEEYQGFIRKLDPEIVSIYQKITERQKKYRGRISKWQSQVNNFYLKANQVPGGIKNYSKIVEFILQYKEFLPDTDSINRSSN